jgi:hypothetical protein
VTVLLGILKYVVGSSLTFGGPIKISTPGGMEIGVRPSLDGRIAVAEKDLLVALDVTWKAGTRKLGRLITDEAEIAFSTARSRLGASIFLPLQYFRCLLLRARM